MISHSPHTINNYQLASDIYKLIIKVLVPLIVLFKIDRYIYLFCYFY